MRVKNAVGQDSHRFDFNDKTKTLKLAGVVIENQPPLSGNSDADVVLHAVTNAISGITGRNILGKVADEICQGGITDSAVYLQEALRDLPPYKISNLSISIEALKPKLAGIIPLMKTNIGKLLSIPVSDIGITATTGEGLTDFGKGLGIQVFCILTVYSE